MPPDILLLSRPITGDYLPGISAPIYGSSAHPEMSIGPFKLADGWMNGRSIEPVDTDQPAWPADADLLMPNYIFEPMADQIGKTTFRAVEELRQKFKTSITATAIRLVEYGPEPAMLVCHTAKGRWWFCRPRHIPEKWFPQEQLDAESYAMDVLDRKEERSRRVLIGADAWFDRREAQQFELYEETCRTTDNEILTLLVFKDEDMLDE